MKMPHTCYYIIDDSTYKYADEYIYCFSTENHDLIKKFNEDVGHLL